MAKLISFKIKKFKFIFKFNFKIFKQAKEIHDIKIIRYEESLYYSNIENFKYQVMKLSETHPEEIAHALEKSQKEDEIEKSTVS